MFYENHHDMGEICLECGRSVAWGSGRYVNRVPIDREAADVPWLQAPEAMRATHLDGYLCAECLSKIDAEMEAHNATERA